MKCKTDNSPSKFIRSVWRRGSDQHATKSMVFSTVTIFCNSCLTDLQIEASLVHF